MAPKAGDTPQVQARRLMLAQLAGALEALLRRLTVQREVAVGACSLAPRAEEIAQRARKVAFGRGRLALEGVTELAASIGELAAEAAAIVAQLSTGAALAGEVAAAISSHVRNLAALSQDPAALSDPATLRRALTGLSGTLQDLASQRRAQGSAAAALVALAGRAQDFAEQAVRITESSAGEMREEALRLSRELGSFAEEAVQVAAEITRDAELGERSLAAMTGEMRQMAGPRSTDPVGDGVDRRIATMLSRPAEAPAGPLGGVLEWGRRA